MIAFEQMLAQCGQRLRRGVLGTLQINVGRKCNQACRHCHVDAGPWREEMMTGEVARRVAEWIGRHRPPVVDLTGGAPELSAHFRFLVESARSAGARVIDRSNLTILEVPGQEDLASYLARHEVEVVASLPCYSAENVNRQRGNGVFEKSIRGLQKLNALGYGTRLVLNLVYNPVGPVLPGPQAELEADYREVLRREHGVVFHRLFTITNQPIARFAAELREQGRWDEYLGLLVDHFNPETVGGLMCRTTLSVGYEGELYDCDFNQMLGLALAGGRRRHLWEVSPGGLEEEAVATGPHCFACTAGAGSSCTGAVLGG